MMLMRSFALVLSVVYSTYASVTLSPSLSVIVKEEGSTFSVNCTSRNSIGWSVVPSGKLPGNVATLSHSGDNISTLTFEKVPTSYNNAIYRCLDSEGDATFTLKVFSVTRIEPEFVYNDVNVLGCGVKDSSLTFTYFWSKDGTAIKDLKPSDAKWGYKEVNDTLELTKVSRDMAGVWKCMAVFKEGSHTSSLEVDVNLWAKPYVIPFEKSKNLVQDEKLSVECSVLGHPKPTITWYKGPLLIKDDDHYRLEPADTYAGKPIKDARMIISSVDFDDEGLYTCMAVSSYANFSNYNASQGVLVRVKDKLAALWPFLGIVAEVVILCTIIFIYEKKRNKDAAADENPVQDGTAPEKMSEGVRHRGTNNPRA